MQCIHGIFIVFFLEFIYLHLIMYRVFVDFFYLWSGVPIDLHLLYMFILEYFM